MFRSGGFRFDGPPIFCRFVKCSDSRSADKRKPDNQQPNADYRVVPYAVAARYRGSRVITSLNETIWRTLSIVIQPVTSNVSIIPNRPFEVDDTGVSTSILTFRLHWLRRSILFSKSVCVVAPLLRIKHSINLWRFAL